MSDVVKFLGVPCTYYLQVDEVSRTWIGDYMFVCIKGKGDYIKFNNKQPFTLDIMD